MTGRDAILTTDRLLLRRQRPADVEPLADLWTDPEVTRHLGGARDRARVVASLEETARDPAADSYDLWPVVELASGSVVGHAGLLAKEVEGRAEIELVYVFARSAWGRGYATEIARALAGHAFGARGLARLISLIEPGNSASERVAVKVGMRLEAEVVRPSGARRLLYAMAEKPPRPSV